MKTNYAEILEKAGDDSLAYGVGILIVVGGTVRHVPVTEWMDFSEQLTELYAMLPDADETD